jgi:microcystin-dependent protein
MSDQFLAEIRIFAGNFAPFGWAFCDGQILSISQNAALFSLLGTTYGGNGQSNFALPNLQGSAPMHQGQGAGLSFRDLGETGGEQTVMLLSSEMPAHSHTLSATTTTGTTATSTNNQLALATAGGGKTSAANIVNSYSSAAANTPLNSSGLSTVGGNLPHNNMMPYLGLTFIIALQGIFPARS